MSRARAWCRIAGVDYEATLEDGRLSFQPEHLEDLVRAYADDGRTAGITATGPFYDASLVEPWGFLGVVLAIFEDLRYSLSYPERGWPQWDCSEPNPALTVPQGAEA